MPSSLLPLFPLQVVVFPRTWLPLHIFEERYKELIGNAIRDNSEFGVVLARENGIVNAGCSVTVDKVLEMYPDGRMDIVARGRRRFEIVRLDEEKPFLRAEVEYFDDEDSAPTPDELRTEALGRFQDLSGLENAGQRGDPDLTDPQLSFQLAQSLPDLDFQNLLLRNRSEPARLRELNQYLASYIPRRRTIEHMRQVAPTNGHGGPVSGA